jgi:hypothetical protein
MASVRIINIKRAEQDRVTLTIEGATSIGTADLEITISEQGSRELNEKQAMLDCLELLEQFAEALRVRLKQ